MRYEDIYVAGLGVHVGDPEPVEHAIARGEYTVEEARRTGQRAAAVAAEPPDRLPAPLMAVRAARQALSQTRLTPDSVLYGHVHFQGLDFWNAACYLREQLGIPAGPGVTLTLGAMSNSVVVGLELAADRLASCQDETVLVAAADRFGGTRFPRWSTDHGVVYGDGAAAAVLTRGTGIAKLIAAASWSDGSLEGLHRGEEPFAPADGARRTALDIRARKRAWLANASATTVHTRNAVGVTDVVKRVLADADLDLAEVAVVCGPHYGRRLVRSQILEPLGLDARRSTLEFGLDVGHLGAADQLVAVHHLLRTGAVRVGDHVLLLGAGVGMTWTAAILTITAPA